MTTDCSWYAPLGHVWRDDDRQVQARCGIDQREEQRMVCGHGLMGMPAKPLGRCSMAISPTATAPDLGMASAFSAGCF